jgi:hypothetical protein
MVLLIQAPELEGVMTSNLFWLTAKPMKRLKPFQNRRKKSVESPPASR